MASDNSGLDDFRSIYDRAEIDADVSNTQTNRNFISNNSLSIKSLLFGQPFVKQTLCCFIEAKKKCFALYAYNTTCTKYSNTNTNMVLCQIKHPRGLCPRFIGFRNEFFRHLHCKFICV